MGSKKAKPTVSTSEPWKGVQPYLTGAEGKPGIFPEAANLFQQGGMNSNMQSAVDEYSKGLINRTQDPRLANFDSAPYEMMNFGRNLGNGGMDTNFGRVKDISTPSVGLTQARASQGVLDPTNSLKSLLSGQVANPYLDQQAQAMTANLTRNLNENVMPGIRSEALASGQYGGSRQGIAEGLAASRLNQDLAPALTNLYGGAFENAQNRMFGTATGLNEQAVNNATNNANRQFAGNQFNADLGLRNNEQQIGQNTQNLSNRMQGANLANNAMGMLNNFNAMQDNSFDRYMNTQQMPQNINWNNLNQYAGIISPGSGMGGTQSQTNTKNVGAGALGGALGGAGIASMLSLSNPATAGLAGLGALAGLF
jgi:hypothetical protein